MRVCVCVCVSVCLCVANSPCKLKNCHVGSYIITKALPRDVYEIADLRNKEVTLRVTEVHLKPYNKSNESTSTPSDVILQKGILQVCAEDIGYYIIAYIMPTL